MNFEDNAYAFAAAFHGVKPKGSTPTVKYEKRKWKVKGGYAVGLYRSYRLPILKWVIWDRIWVVDNAQKWSCTCHEMSHCLDARWGKKKNEAKAEACERAAAEAGQPE